MGPEGSAEGFCGRFPRKVILEGRRILRKVLAEGFCGRFRGRFFLPMLRIVFLGGGWFRGRFLRKVLRKVFAEGSAEGFCGRSLAEDLCGRFPEGFRKDSGRFWAFSSDLPHPEGFLQKVPRKVFAEGSAEGFCGRFRGRFPEGFPRKVQNLISSLRIIN